MQLHYTIDTTGFNKLSEDIQGLYKSEGDGYQLNVKGAAPKSKVDEFRDTSTTAMKERDAALKKYDSFDHDGYAEFQSTKQQLADKKLIEAGDIDSLVASKLAVVTSDFEAKLDRANQQINDLTSNNSSIVNKYEIQGATSKAFSEFKIRPEMQGALTAQINSMFTVKEGNVVAMNGDQIITGSNGNLSINEFISTQDDAFKIPSGGGRGNGGGVNGVNKTLNRGVFDAMPPAEQMEFMKAGGKTVD